MALFQQSATFVDLSSSTSQFTSPVANLADLLVDAKAEFQPLGNPEIPVLPPEGDKPVSFVGGIDHKIFGGDGSEIITGHDDNFLGFGGDDLIHAGGGNDTVYAGEGNDIVRGGAGNDKLYGMSGNDQIAGGTGNDYISGGPGNDKMYGEAGNDELWGGTGNDLLSGGTGNDTLRGSAGNDQLFGGAGNDSLQGGTGNDLMNGGQGADVMTGGSGSDKFVFTSVQDSLNLYGLSDLITDFQKGSDKLDFSQIDANETVAGNQAFKLVAYGGPNQVLGAGQMTAHYDVSLGKTIIEANVDGDASNEFHLELSGNHVPTASDMIL
jgi:Ca2+-binding RTX toxin-like protein